MRKSNLGSRHFLHEKPIVKQPPPIFNNKRVFEGFISPRPEDKELPNDVFEETIIKFGSTKWRPSDRRCRITVEWATKGQP